MNRLNELRIYGCEREIHLMHQDSAATFATHWKALANAMQLITFEWQGTYHDRTPHGEIRRCTFKAAECLDGDPLQELWQQAADRIHRDYRYKDGK